FRDRVVKNLEIEENATSIHENFIVLYSFSYYLNPNDDNWNIGLSVTNIDNFSINQETNPLLFLRGVYDPFSRLGLFTEFCYKPAGICNLAVNHFGFFLRTGIKWNVN
ncbi:MAG TPA: hypothetical protein DDW27_10055, partial [Bacteroidales bacterium]|nr:hypothetical protein [Bacteroidales bacterium]